MPVKGKRANSPPVVKNDPIDKAVEDEQTIVEESPGTGFGPASKGSYHDVLPGTHESRYSPVGNQVPNVEYETRGDEEDAVSALEETDTVSGGDSCGGSYEKTEDGVDARTRLPTPPAKQISDPREFFAYWKTLPKKLQDRVVVYVYRKWPVIDRYWCPKCEASLAQPAGKKGKCLCLSCGWTGKISTHIDKLVEPIDARDVIQLYGTGHYSFMLIDTTKGVGGAVCSTVVKTQTDYRNYPPAIADKRDVVVSDPLNLAYIQSLKINEPRAKLRGVEREEGGYMAGEVDKMVMPLINKIVDMSEEKKRVKVERDLRGRRNRARQSREQAPPTQVLDTMARLMADTAQKTNDFTLRAAEQARGMAGDPLDMIGKVAGVLKSFNPPATNGGDGNQTMMSLVADLLQRDSDANKAVVEIYRKQNEALVAQQQQIQARLDAMAIGAAKPKTITESIAELAEMKKQLREVMGEPETSAEPFDWGKLAAQVLPGALQLMASMVMAKSGAAVPVVADPGTGVPVPATGSGQVGVQSPMPGQPQGQATAQGNPQQTTTANQEEEIMLQYITLFNSIQERLVKLLTDGEDGAILAEELIGWQGPEKYHMLKSLAPEQIKGALLQYGSNNLKQIILTQPALFDQFLTEFLTAFDKPVEVSNADGDEEEGEEPAEPVVS